MDTLGKRILNESELEFQFWVQCIQEPLVPTPEWHVKLFGVETDFSWPEAKLIVCIQGGVTDGTGRSRGTHVRADGYTKDRDLSNAAQLAGWTMLEFTKRHLDGNSALLTVKAFFLNKVAKQLIENTHYAACLVFVQSVSTLTSAQCAPMLIEKAKRLLEFGKNDTAS